MSDDRAVVSDDRSFQSDDRSFQSHDQSFQRDARLFQSHDRSFQRDDRSFQRDTRPFQSHDRPFQSHDRPFQSHDRPFQGHDRPFQSHDRSFQSHDRSFQSHDRSFQSHDRSFQSHDRPFQSHDRPFQSHDRLVMRHDRPFQGNDRAFLTHDRAVRGPNLLVLRADRPYSRLRRDGVGARGSGQPKDAWVVASDGPVAASGPASTSVLPPRPTTPADGSWLVERYLARDPAAEPEMVLQLNRLLHRVYKFRWSKKKLSFFELRGDCFTLLTYWRETGILRVEPLAHLAQRLMKQCGRQAMRDSYKDTKLLRLDVAFGSDRDDKRARGRGRRIERRASLWNAPPTPEQSLLARELYVWLVGARERLGPQEQQTYDVSVRLEEGEVASLHEALGVSDPTARQRRRRMRAAIAVLARQDGMSQVIDRWRVGRAPRRDREDAAGSAGSGEDAGRGGSPPADRKRGKPPGGAEGAGTSAARTPDRKTRGRGKPQRP